MQSAVGDGGVANLPLNSNKADLGEVTMNNEEDGVEEKDIESIDEKKLSASQPKESVEHE